MANFCLCKEVSAHVIGTGSNSDMMCHEQHQKTVLNISTYKLPGDLAMVPERDESHYAVILPIDASSLKDSDDLNAIAPIVCTNQQITTHSDQDQLTVSWKDNVVDK